MTTQATDLDTLKQRLHRTWSAGDYGRIARGMERSAEAFVDRIGVRPGERVLDVACGAGQVAIPAARTGATVAGLDLAAPWIAQARERAADEGLNIAFDVGDAEALPYPDAGFDVVVSLIGVMFAPRPEVAAAELARVCRPGGRIVLGNWTPEGFIGAFFRTVGAHVPPPDMPSPMLWGTEETVRERLGPHVRDLQTERRHLHFEYPVPPSELIPLYLECFGPTKTACESLDAAGRQALQADLVALWEAANEAGDRATELAGEILEVTAIR